MLEAVAAHDFGSDAADDDDRLLQRAALRRRAPQG